MRLIGISLAFCAGLAVTSARAEILIGVAAPMSGAFAPIGNDIKMGVDAAVAAINAAGGINGETLGVEAVDDKCEGKTGEAVANQLVGKGVLLVIGHPCTAAAIPAATVYAAHSIVFISPAATNPRLTDEKLGPGVFRMGPRSDEQEKALGAYLIQHFGSTRVGFVHDGSVYGQGFVEAVRTIYEARGPKSVMTDAFTSGEKSQITLAGKIQDAALTAVVIGGLQSDAAVIAAEIRGRGLTAALFGNEVLGLQEYRDIAGDAAEGTIFTLPKSYRDMPSAEPVVSAFLARDIDPSNAILAAYAAVEVWTAAATGATDFVSVTGRLHAENFDSTIGPVAFDKKGDLRGAGYDLYVWRGADPVRLN